MDKMTEQSSERTIKADWSELLIQAVNQPGMILKAYSAFHGYVRHAI